MKFVNSHYDKIAIVLVLLTLGIVGVISFLEPSDSEKKNKPSVAHSFSIDSVGGEDVLVLLKETQLVPGDSIEIHNIGSGEIEKFSVKKVIFSKKSRVTIQMKSQEIYKGRLLNPSSTILTAGWDKSRNPIALDTEKGVKNISFKDIKFIRGEQKLVLDKEIDTIDERDSKISVYQTKSQFLNDSNRTEKSRWTSSATEGNSSIYDLFTPPIIYLVNGELTTTLPEAPTEEAKEEEFGLTVVSFEKNHYRLKLASWIGKTPYFEDFQTKVSANSDKYVKNRLELNIPYKENENYRPGMPSLIKTSPDDEEKLVQVEFFTVQQVKDPKTGGAKMVGRALVRDFKKGGKPFEINSLMEKVDTGDYKINLKFDIAGEVPSSIELDANEIEKVFNFGNRSYKLLRIDKENKNIEIEKRISGTDKITVKTLNF